MKNLLLSIIFIFAALWSVNAQDISKHAIGLRLGDSGGLGAEISYQHGLKANNRLELDLGFRNHSTYSAFKVSGLYQWVWILDGNFNWYAGVGGSLGSWGINKDHPKEYENIDGTAFINVVGDIGIEYLFDVPIQVFLDLRPEIGLLGDYGDTIDFDIAFGVRYRF
ncbi:MAG: hypothetical protein CSA01_00225 [Bacteroidetes bacterium]|nr:MAG: hypothetical protein CSA01_00225 [Bacteroidota bacterium]